MSDTEVKALASKNAQRAAEKERVYATFEDLSDKPKAFEEFPAVLSPGKGPVWLRFEAIGSEEYDKLLTKHQPSTSQKARGLTYNPDTFAPALLAVVSVLPRLDVQQWATIVKGENWSGGESGFLYDRAIQLCVRGLDPGPTEAG